MCRRVGDGDVPAAVRAHAPIAGWGRWIGRRLGGSGGRPIRDSFGVVAGRLRKRTDLRPQFWWSLVTASAAACGQSTGVVVLGQGMWCPPSMNVTAAPGTSVAVLASGESQGLGHQRPDAVVHGIPLYAPGVAPVFVAPSLQAELTFSGPPQPGVLHSLTYSPRPSCWLRSLPHVFLHGGARSRFTTFASPCPRPGP